MQYTSIHRNLICTLYYIILHPKNQGYTAFSPENMPFFPLWQKERPVSAYRFEVNFFK